MRFYRRSLYPLMTQAMDLESLLTEGICAYRSGDYETAVVLLSKLSQTSHLTFQTKAKMGLIRTYMAQQNWLQAKNLCQILSQHPKSSVQQWAIATLAKIESSLDTSYPSTPQPSISQTLPTPSSAQAASQTETCSGFQPLNSQLKPSQGPARLPSPFPASAKANQLDPHSRVHKASLNSKANGNRPRRNHGLTLQAVDLPNSDPSATNIEEIDGNRDKLHCPLWRQAGRLAQGRPLGKIKQSRLWIAQATGAISFFYLLLTLTHGITPAFNRGLSVLENWFPFLPIRYWPLAYREQAWPILGGIVIATMASPWLWDLLLRYGSGQKPDTLQRLRSASPEAASWVSQYCHQRCWPVPRIRQLPTDVPLLFSYGWLPRQGRLVISDGLLQQLEADEIAALVAYELSHWRSLYWPLLSVHSLVLQGLNQLYWRLALWANGMPHLAKVVVGAAASLSYGLFWLLRMPLLWLSRLRTYYGDRAASEITGNPNGLTRALVKLSFGLACSIEQRGYTPVEIEGLSLLLPTSPDIGRAPWHGQIAFEQLFAWDCSQPLRGWLSLLASHPPLGDRLRLLMAYARHWQLTPEIDLPAPARRQALSKKAWGQLLEQGAPFLGLGIGLAGGLILWLLGAIAAFFGWSLDWMWGDQPLLQAATSLGFGIGTIVRINRFFPDLSWTLSDCPSLGDWNCEPSLLPKSSLPVKLSGVLSGRPGVANWLGQDLFLKTSTGLQKLRFFSSLGPAGNCLTLKSKPTDLLEQPVQVLGWYRRGHSAWIDIDRVRLPNGRSLPAAHPAFSVTLAALAVCWALWRLVS